MSILPDFPTILEQAGCSLETPQDMERSMSVAMLAYNLWVSSPLGARAAQRPQTRRVGRNAPCPCGSGKKYKKCCLRGDQQAGRAGRDAPEPLPFGPEMVLRVEYNDDLLDAFDHLGELLERLPELADVRFPAEEVREFCESELAALGDDPDDWDEWLDELSFRFVVERDQAEAFADLEHKLMAAARQAQTPADIRALTAGLLATSMGAPGDDTPAASSPLVPMMFRRTLGDGFKGVDPIRALMESLDPGGELTRRMLDGDEDALAELTGRLEQADDDKLDALDRFADEGFKRFNELVESDHFPVPLPYATMLPLALKTELLEESGETGWEEKLDAGGEMKRLVEGLCDEDEELYVCIVDEWLVRTADGEVDAEHRRVIKAMRQRMRVQPFLSLFADLVLATIKAGTVMHLDGEAELLDDPGFQALPRVKQLERYGRYLLAQGYPQIARRTWMLCEELGPLPESVQDRIARVDGETRS